jgi:hypothetical protein
MRKSHAGAIGATTALAILAVHCGSSESSSGGSDAGSGDVTSLDASGEAGLDVATSEASPDGSVPDGTLDGGAPDSDASADGGGLDSTVDSGDAGVGSSPDADAASLDAAGDATDGSPEDAADAAPQCQVDAGDSGSGCAGSLACCAGSCVDTTSNSSHCGVCGHACPATQFCGASTCDDPILKNLCANPKATVVQDDYVVDNEAGSAVAAALMTGCMPPVSFTTVGQDAGAVLDQMTHRPILGPGNTLIAGGGSFPQPSVAYLDSNGVSPAFITEDTQTAQIVERSTGHVVVSVPNTPANLNPEHDYFLLVLQIEPVSKTLCFTAAGTAQWGTTAAAYFFANDVLPNLSQYNGSWYAYEWTSAGVDAAPGAADTFTLKGSGL